MIQDYFDDALGTSGGKALEAIGDVQTAGAFADTIYQHGRSDGATLKAAKIAAASIGRTGRDRLTMRKD